MYKFSEGIAEFFSTQRNDLRCLLFEIAKNRFNFGGKKIWLVVDPEKVEDGWLNLPATNDFAHTTINVIDSYKSENERKIPKIIPKFRLLEGEVVDRKVRVLQRCRLLYHVYILYLQNKLVFRWFTLKTEISNRNWKNSIYFNLSVFSDIFFLKYFLSFISQKIRRKFW